MDKKKLNKADYRFKDKKDEVLIKTPGQINGIDFLIRNLENCTVYLCDHISTVISIQPDLCGGQQELQDLHGTRPLIHLRERLSRYV